jgi:hypothetical protein
MKVYLLTPNQVQELIGIEYIPGSYFNPIQDNNGNYVISPEEVEQCSIDWVKQLPEIDYNPIIPEPLF